MLPILLKTLPFFAIIGLGYGAAATRFFAPEATGWLTKFVFYFALPAMLFRFAAQLELAEVFDWRFSAAYLTGTAAVYLVATAVALLRGAGMREAAVEAQCAAIGNVGFLGVPMLALLLGPQAVGPVMMVLSVDLIVFGSLIVILLSWGGAGVWGALRTVARGLATNPMIVAIVAGLAWSAARLPMPAPMEDFLVTLGAAATPGALFAIGASLADKSADRPGIAAWLSSAKLLLHPLYVAFAALVLFEVEPYSAGVMIAAAAMPTAGNVYILAQHYGVAPVRVSSTILVSTAASIVTLTAFIAWVSSFALP